MQIALVDYGAGNPASVRKALVHLGASVATPAGPGDLDVADALVVPGVGHFRATAALDGAWRAAVRQWIERGRPLLGICLGMQWLFEGSDEAPEVAGLGLLPGRCHRLTPGAGLKVPHVGWNALQMRPGSWLLDGVPDGAYVYFTHSYVAGDGPACVATTAHTEPFAAAVERGVVAGLQFHPEKSGEVGLTILRNFLKRCSQDASSPVSTSGRARS